MVAEASVHGDFALLLWACGEEGIMGGAGRGSCSPHSGWEQRDRKGGIPTAPFRVALVMKVFP